MKLDVPYRRLGYVDVAALRDAVLALPEIVWHSYITKSADHYLNAEVQSIVVRHGIVSTNPMYVNTGAYDLLERVLEPVLAQLPGADRVRLARMKPGTMIPEHIDASAYFDLMHRVHVPLLTNPGTVFKFDTDYLWMRHGEVYEIDNKRMHGVVNFGDTDRIHMVVDYFEK